MKKLLLFIGFLLAITYSYSQAGDICFLHTATSGNAMGYVSLIDHPALNNNPTAKVILCHDLASDGSTNYNNNATGMYYVAAQNKWSIVNNQEAAVPLDTSYMVYVEGTQSNMITYTATGGVYYELIDDPFLNNNPSAKIQITTVWNSTAGYDTGVYGVYYSATDKWGIFNEDGGTVIPAGAMFNILLEPALVSHNTNISYTHVANSGNISSNYTTIDHPLLNNNPNARFVAVHNLSGGGTAWAPDHIGLWYSSGASKWTIFTESQASFPVDSSYNLTIPLPAPSNDEASGAIPLTLEPFGTGCSSPVTITNVGATDSTPINGLPGCGSFAGGDVWYYFTAPPSGEVKLFRTITGNWGALSYGIYLLPTSTSALVCDYIPENQTDARPIEGLTAGTTYGLRIWEWNNNDFGTEEICLREWVNGAGIADNIVDGFEMYPNPVENMLNLSALNTIESVSIYNMLGQEVLQTTPATTQVEIDMSALSTGSYIIKVQAGNQIGSYNLIKQ